MASFVRFRRYVNVVITSTQNRGGGPESRDIARVSLVIMRIGCSATLLDEDVYGTDDITRGWSSDGLKE